GHEPRHYPDPDLRNNAIENLRWVPDGTNLIDPPALVEAGKKRIPHRALTDDDALEAIRLASAGETITSIAARFGVAKPTIEGMLYHKTYRHLEQPPPTSGLSFTHISLLTEVLTVINLAAIFHNTVHLFELSDEPNENTITV